VSDAEFRRAQLERSLVNPKNAYSQERLLQYGLGTQGWDLLPEWTPVSKPMTALLARALLVGASPEPLEAVWDAQTPRTFEAWIALGKAVFFRYPLRAEVFVRFALEHPDQSARYGIIEAADGTLPGLLAFDDEAGKRQLGISCALCHSNVREGSLIVGEARRAFDFGALRLAQAEASGATLEPALAKHFGQWGPGRADVTDDDAEDPVAIPDLWGLRQQTYLTQAGTIRQDGPAALMLRQETQLLTTNHARTRPPRVLAAALALYLYTLEAPKTFAPVSEHGQTLFNTKCASCHSNAAGGGALVSQASLQTDPALALGTARGTGFYRPPALLRVQFAAPYLHHGAVPSLDDLLSPERLQAGYTRSPLGKGAVPGHTYGTDLSKQDRDALVAYLRTL
jgi:cytochrome c5